MSLIGGKRLRPPSRSTRVGARYIFGMKVTGDSINEHSARVALAFKMQLYGYRPEFDKEQHRYASTSSAGRLHITQFLRSGIDGFHCTIKETPSDYTVHEIDETGRRIVPHRAAQQQSTSLGGASDRKLLQSNAVVERSSDELALVDVDEAQSAKLGMKIGGLFSQAITRGREALEEAQREAEARRQGDPKSWGKRFDFSSVGPEDSDQSLSLHHGTWTLLTIPSSELTYGEARMLLYELNRSKLLLEDYQHHIVHLDYQDVGLTEEERTALGDANSLGEQWVFQLRYSHQLFDLARILTKHYAVQLRRFLLDQHIDAERRLSWSKSASIKQPFVSPLLRIPWLEERIVKLIQRTGIIMADHDKQRLNHSRTDVRRTTKLQKVKVVSLLQSLAPILDGRIIGSQGRLFESAKDEMTMTFVSADTNFLRVMVGSLEHTPGVEEAASEDTKMLLEAGHSHDQLDAGTSDWIAERIEHGPTQPEGGLLADGRHIAELTSCGDTANALEVPRVGRLKIIYRETVIEAILEKRGLTWDFIVDDLKTEILAQRQERLRLKEGLEIEVPEMEGASQEAKQQMQYLQESTMSLLERKRRLIISCTGAIERHSHSFQRIRIRGASVQEVQEAAKVIARGGSTQPTALDADTLKDDANDRKAMIKGLAGKREKNKDFDVKFDFKRKTTTRARVGDTLMSHNGRKKFSGVEKYVDGGGDTATEEQVKRAKEFWSLHWYKLHDIKVEAQAEAASYVMVDATKSGIKRSVTSVLNEVERKLRHHDLQIGNLWGYAYNVVLRHVQESNLKSCPSDREIRRTTTSACNAIMKTGFINYFGPHRFGNHCRKNALPGLHLLLGHWRAAANVLVDVGNYGTFASVNSSSAHLNNMKQRMMLCRSGSSAMGLTPSCLATL